MHLYRFSHNGRVCSGVLNNQRVMPIEVDCHEDCFCYKELNSTATLQSPGYEPVYYIAQSCKVPSRGYFIKVMILLYWSVIALVSLVVIIIAARLKKNGKNSNNSHSSFTGYAFSNHDVSTKNLHSVVTTSDISEKRN